jgi:hypothetical protein
MTFDRKVFHEIPRSADRDLLLHEFAKYQCDLFIKLSDNKTISTKVKKWTAPFKLQLEYPKSLRPIVQNQVPIQIIHRGDRYFAYAFILDTGQEFYVVIEGSIFKVQRRKDARIRLPIDYPAIVEVFEMNGHKMNESVILKDISQGGCSIKVSNTMHCEMGSYIGLKIKIGERSLLTEYGHIRFSKVFKDQIDLGIRFIKTTSSATELTPVLQDLYAELFSKWYKRR